MTKKKAWKVGGEQTEHCTDFDAHRNRKTTNTLSSNRARHTAPSVKPRQAKMKARNENTKQRGTLCSNTSVPPPKKRLPPKTYVWHDKLCNTFIFSSFPTPRRTRSSTSGIGHTPQKKKRARKRKKKNLHRVRKEPLVVITQRFPHTFFFNK